MYIIHEYQTNKTGVTAVVPPVTKNTIDEAYNAYYTACAASAISSVPYHTVMLCYHNGNVIESKMFEHLPQPVEEEINNG